MSTVPLLCLRTERSWYAYTRCKSLSLNPTSNAFILFVIMKNKFIEVYNKIISECKDLYVENTTRSKDPEEYIKKIVDIAENQKKIHERNDKYWVWIPYDAQFNWNFCRISEQMSIVYFGDAEKDKEEWRWYYISRSDDWKQPKDEHLLHIYFSTWAYFLSSAYPTNTFQKMREELKLFWPKYCDTTNKWLYFSLDQCKDICKEYPNIIKKYREIATEEIKEKEKETLREKLAKLEEM